MKLVNFSVTNFRSITNAHKILISKTTILVGQNNEGKSNVLKALDLAMDVLKEHASVGIESLKFAAAKGFRLDSDERSYSWNRDFPIALQGAISRKQTIFRLEFFLEDEEIAEFSQEIKSSLNGTLPIEIRIGKDGEASVKVSKRGKGGKSLTAKSWKIAQFIGNKISFNYIPAIRTDTEAMRVIGEMLSNRLRVLEDEKTYQKALDTISELQKPLLKDLAQKIKEPLVEFLPNIQAVKIEMSEQSRRARFRSDFEVIIDDGTPTRLEFKGDGVKSLAALGLLKGRDDVSGASIIAIEEPESHLHPAAIHQLNDVIESLAGENQIILSTHNPLFIDRQNIKSNIIIKKGRATPAKNVGEIREILGIKASDNLVNASYVLLVEGMDDKISLTALMTFLSGILGKALRSNHLIIDEIGGAGNLSYKLSLLSNSLCVCHTFLDNDDSGRKAFEKAESDRLLSLKNCTMVICKGMKNSELEDCFEPVVYKQSIGDGFGVDLDVSEFRSDSKWSRRMEAVFLNQGKQWNTKIKKTVKEVVAQSVSDQPDIALNAHKRNSIDALVRSLESLLAR